MAESCVKWSTDAVRKRTEKSLMMRKLFHAFKGELMPVKTQKRSRKRPKFGGCVTFYFWPCSLFF